MISYTYAEHPSPHFWVSVFALTLFFIADSIRNHHRWRRTSWTPRPRPPFRLAVIHLGGVLLIAPALYINAVAATEFEQRMAALERATQDRVNRCPSLIPCAVD
jgi:hypothetical protein